ncbi:hypothetical protein [Methylobacterium nonmethylotrophicum]|uniref:Uncharacterized protein n=1 Tax=Methylobacterium nonmethylotrophicum TaxID=1141884 RepID=A0A4Z0NJ71_9HYPH|nr:hypothetical protein [Methylobacterium nonmethylotrophicum]TGD95533.1 hypothetical protein EU555_27700 [Methylobacterium nonmethylotrophicum]
MVKRTVCFSVCAVLLLSGTASAQGLDGMVVLKGVCSPKSHIAEGRIGEDLTRRQSRFFCDAAVITTPNGQAGRRLVNFAESRSHTRPPIGFAGTMVERDIMQVHRVYLQSGQALAVSDGYCKFFSTNKAIHGIACGAKIDNGGRRTVPIVAFDGRVQS